MLQHVDKVQKEGDAHHLKYKQPKTEDQARVRCQVSGEQEIRQGENLELRMRGMQQRK